ncbi:unnamed protein product [Adineta ricciae]|uniref:Beta-galactosidase n=1 Tax=Adineta ricciae TaxID=249248 RepID=A0A813YSA5_ADIRI|nr:unnamed protein product [Adineta ricciae]
MVDCLSWHSFYGSLRSSKSYVKDHSKSRTSIAKSNLGFASHNGQLEKKQCNSNNNNNNGIVQLTDDGNLFLEFYIFNISRERSIHLCKNPNDKRLLIFYNVSNGLYKIGVRNVSVVFLLILRAHLRPSEYGNQTLILGEERRLSIRLYKEDDPRRTVLRPFRILSGSLQYFRIVPQSWADRIALMKDAGLNTVETFVPWNVHEREVGKYQFDNLIKFLELVHQNEMFTIIRPSPYIGAEWDFGGLPSWLLSDDEMIVRSNYPGYIKAVERYYDALFPILAKYQYNRRTGGSIIAFQIEHEYGSYSQDKAYLEKLRSMYVKHGLDEIFFTSDAPRVLQQGTLDNVWATINFQREVTTRVDKLIEFRSEAHVMITEYRTGAFDEWGKPHRTGDQTPYNADELELDVEEILLTAQYEISVNFYMFCGGTNFGFTAGANHFEMKHYVSTVTSYDYNAPISESGDMTGKYHAIRNVLKKFYEQNPTLVIYNHERTAADTFEPKDLTDPKKIAYGKVKITDYKSFEQILEDSAIGTKYQSETGPLGMEDLKKTTITEGYIVYINKEIPELIKAADQHTISIPEVADSVTILVDGENVYYANQTSYAIENEIPAETKVLTIFVENLGRINYGTGLDYSRKGILNNVLLDKKIELKKWLMVLLEFDRGLTGVTDWKPFVRSEDSTTSHLARGPKLFRGSFTIEESQEIEDTFLAPGPRWGKGVAFVNGHNLGRYWKIGPQKTLYIPKHFLVKGINYIYLFETHHYGQEVKLVDKPILAAY